MKLVYRLKELANKSWVALSTRGFGFFLRKLKIFLSRDLLGKNLSLIVSRGSYSLLWQKVFETYKTKGLLIFTVRFVLVVCFGWLVLFVTPKIIDFVPEKKIMSWYKSNKRKVSIVIPTYNDFKLTQVCIDSIRETCDMTFVEIIVVDDGSDKIFTDKLKELPVKLILGEKNEGFAKTVNKGLKQVTNDVVLLNNDTQVKKGWLEALQYWAYSDPKIGIVGPKLLYPDQTIQWAGTYRNKKESDWFDHYFRFQTADFEPSNHSYPVLSATGACMYIKKVVIDKIGILDEGFGMAFEDVDYCLRAWQSGFRVVYCPKSIVTHFESKTRGKKQGERELKSKDYFWQKWKEFFDQRNVRDKKGKLQIIYVTLDNGVGGGPRVIFEHLNRLKKLGHSVSLYSLDSTPDWFKLEVPVKTFKTYSELLADLREVEALKVATWWETAETVWEASVLKGIPFFLVQDVESSYYKNDPEYQSKVLSNYRNEFNYLTVSDWDREQLEGIGVNAQVVNPGIAEIFRQTHEAREENQLLALGRSLDLKNFQLTEKAWRLMDPRPKLKLFGIEPRLGQSLGVDYVYKPTDEKVVSLYNQSQVFVQTSIHEGFCLPVLEAMACGTAVVCTQADGNREFCVDRENCLIVSKTNPKDVAEKVKEVFKNDKLRQKIVGEGLKTAQRYRWDKKIKELESYYLLVARKFGNN